VHTSESTVGQNGKLVVVKWREFSVDFMTEKLVGEDLTLVACLFAGLSPPSLCCV
jgi:hypothetical protein